MAIAISDVDRAMIEAVNNHQMTGGHHVLVIVDKSKWLAEMEQFIH